MDMTFYTVFVLVLLGLIAGSLAGAQVWRLRLRQLTEDKKTGEPVNAAEYRSLKKLAGKQLSDDRSLCLHCGHTLAWYDLLPLVSWMSTRGMCRYCHKPIGTFEPSIEIAVAVVYVVSYLFWPAPLQGPIAWAAFVVYLVMIVLLAILCSYDLKWFLLPNRINAAFAVVAALFTGLFLTSQSLFDAAAILSIAGALIILPGLYAALYYYSRWRRGEDGTWVGFGDVKLAIGLALWLHDWQLALVAIVCANLLGTIVVTPALLMHRASRTTRVPFGPFLIVGSLIAFLRGAAIIHWYLTLVV